MRFTVAKYILKTSITSSSISARLDKKNLEKQARQLIIYYLAGVRHPEKQNLPSSRRRQKVAEGKTRSTSLPSRKKSGDVVAIPSASPRIPRARIYTYYVYIYTYIHLRVHTFLPVCSRVQIGIEKSRSQLKLEAQRIRRDKIPIISCPRRVASSATLPPPLFPSFPARSTKRKRRKRWWRTRKRGREGKGLFPL